MVKGTDNLKSYVREAALPRMTNDRFAPPMPPDGHKSHQNTLKVRPESWRRLENIYTLENFRMEEVITACASDPSRLRLYKQRMTFL